MKNLKLELMKKPNVDRFAREILQAIQEQASPLGERKLSITIDDGEDLFIYEINVSQVKQQRKKPTLNFLHFNL